jgi:small subunit ribosomal protein S17
MAEKQRSQTARQAGASRRNTKVGNVVSTKMAKTIVVEVDRQKAHPMYRRVISRSKKFYAHDENDSAHVGDVVRIEETRPLSKLKRWRLIEVIRRAALAPLAEEAAATAPQA